MYRLFFTGCAIAALTSCATADYSEESSPSQEASIFETALATFDTAKTAAKACHIKSGKRSGKNLCPDAVPKYDRAACLAFDAAIQPALEPLRYCAEEKIAAQDPAMAEQCQAYIAQFMAPCLGVHALQLTYADQVQSQAYRTAKQSGLSHDEALQSAAPNLTRYRD